MLVAVTLPREKWDDNRLDDLNKKVDEGFADVRAEIADTKTEMRAGFARIDGEFHQLRNEMNARFAALNRNLLAGFFAIVAAIVGSHAL
jgi:hypothetical protein